MRADLLDKVANAIIARRKKRTGANCSRARKARPARRASARPCARARIFNYFAGEALRRHGQTLESTRPGLDVATYREALGVVGLITPWNFPDRNPRLESRPALAFGNTVVLEAGQHHPGDSEVALTEVIAHELQRSGGRIQPCARSLATYVAGRSSITKTWRR